ncbi:hypothetical protein PCE1_001244 [Barthelona sp. PCE]
MPQYFDKGPLQPHQSSSQHHQSDNYDWRSLRFHEKAVRDAIDHMSHFRARHNKKDTDELPIAEHRQRILDTVRDTQFTIVVGDPGSGKTTQLPQYLLSELNRGKSVVCTQPRRVAAVSVAKRVSFEQNCPVGSLVGYSVRFDNQRSERTRLVYMTDGMLLREIVQDPMLNKYQYIMIDEAHERSVNSDLLLSLIKALAAKRPSLRVIVSSATINADLFVRYFGQERTNVMHVGGRPFSVTNVYTNAPCADYVHDIVQLLMTIHTQMPIGDVLVFLSGADDISQTKTQFENVFASYSGENSNAREPSILPLYSALPLNEQQRVFAPGKRGTRKIVLSTNIAETSLTVQGVKYVIDSGFHKQLVYNAASQEQGLIRTYVSQQSANQRSGRAGRVSSGICFRMFTKTMFQREMPAVIEPEIARSRVEDTVLFLSMFRVTNPFGYDWITPPSAEALTQAIQTLHVLQLLSRNMEVTPLGRSLSTFPLTPRLGTVFINSIRRGVGTEVAIILSVMTAGTSVFHTTRDGKLLERRKQLLHNSGDHMTLHNVFRAWMEREYSRDWCLEFGLNIKTLERAKNISQQLLSIVTRYNVEKPVFTKDEIAETVLKCFLTAYHDQIAILDKTGLYRTVYSGRIIGLGRGSTLQRLRMMDLPEMIVFDQIVTIEARSTLVNTSHLEPVWISEMLPWVKDSISHAMK